MGQALRQLALWLGLATFFAQGIAPPCLVGMLGGLASQAGQHSVVICTLHGIQTVQLDKDGKPVPGQQVPSQQDGTCPMCAGCVMGHAFVNPVPAALPVPSEAVLLPPLHLAELVLVGQFYLPYSSRAPPASQPTI
jgi:hypothetical protein